MVFYAAFNSISVISRQQLTLFMSFLGFTSTRLGSEAFCPRTLPRKNPEDPVGLQPRTTELRVKHFTTEPRWTLKLVEIESICREQDKCSLKTELLSGIGRKHCGEKKGNAGNQHFLLFPQCFQTPS